LLLPATFEILKFASQKTNLLSKLHAKKKKKCFAIQGLGALHLAFLSFDVRTTSASGFSAGGGSAAGRRGPTQ
jgi:hypothetical protein